jgi:regulatory protein
MTESELYQKWLDKLEQFCASQERCNFDVRTKMIKLNVPENDHKHIIEKLTTDGFINEERYTKSFVRGKINYKKDGKTKIRYKLIQKQIPAQIIQTVLADFQDEIYTENIERLVERKWVQLIQKNEKTKAKEKLINYMRGKGYSYNEIQVVFRTLE